MSRLKFYDIDENYIDYLKTFDHQVPNIRYNKFNKFFCGIVLQVGQYNYFCPGYLFNQTATYKFLDLR